MTDRLTEIKEREKKATDAPWVYGSWNILDEDRPAQKRGEPYWTLDKNPYGCSAGIVQGPIGRKAMDTEMITEAVGYEADSVEISEEDTVFITHSRSDIPYLIKRLEDAEKQLKILIKHYETSNHDHNWAYYVFDNAIHYFERWKDGK